MKKVFFIVGLFASLVTLVFMHSPSVMAHPHSEAPTIQNAAWFKSDDAPRSVPNFSFADLAENVQASVVNISTSKMLKRSPFPAPQWKFGPQDPFEDFFEKFFEDMPQQREMRSLGSGFIVSKEGEILTNYHVISMADDISVKLSNGKTYKATIVGGDEKRDIAIIKIKAKEDLPAVKLGDSSIMRAGDWVMAIGNPIGLEHTVTVGVVSAMNRNLSEGPFAKFIQIDCPINPGNSGGPLFNTKGEVIGVNTMIYGNAQGIGFAIPINLVKQLLPDLISKGKVSRGWLGVSIQPITDELAKSFGMEKAEGVLVSDVNAGSPAAKVGIKRGDIILKVGSELVNDPKDLAVAVSNSSPGKDVPIEYLRDGKKNTVDVQIGTWEESKTLVKGESDLMGLVVREITLEDKQSLDVPTNFKGVIVDRISNDSTAAMAGIREGDVILEINSEKIDGMEAYNREVGKLKKDDLVRIFLRRGRSSIYAAFKL